MKRINNMILQCKNCSARYLVPDSSIGAEGRTVRCARCNESWYEPPIEAPSDGFAPLSEPTPEPDIAQTPEPESTEDFDKMIGSLNAAANRSSASSNLPVYRPTISTGLKVAVAALLVIVAGLGLFMTMPKLFGILPSKGLVLADIKIEKNSEEKPGIVEITGNILNESEEPRTVPNIKVILLDGADNPLQSWEFKSNGATLKSKETTPFTSGELNMKFSIAKRFVIDMGTPVELALRRKPQ